MLKHHDIPGRNAFLFLHAVWYLFLSLVYFTGCRVQPEVPCCINKEGWNKGLCCNLSLIEPWYGIVKWCRKWNNHALTLRYVDMTNDHTGISVSRKSSTDTVNEDEIDYNDYLI